MKAEEALSVAKTYVNQTLVGMGALKGAPCTIKSQTKSGRLTTTVFEWTDTNNVKHESTMLVYDGLDGTNGTDGTDGVDGFSPTVTVKSSTSTEYILTITDKNGSYDTPNLKGSGGGGGASALTDLTDVQLSSLASGDALVFNGSKWVNVTLAAVATSGSYNDLSDKPTIPAAQIQSDWNQSDSAEVDFIKNKPTIPSAQVQSDWNQSDNSQVDFIKNKPTIPASQIQSDWDQADNTKLDFIKNKPTIPDAQIQSDWSQSDNTKLDFIKNKPTLGTAAALDSTSSVVKNGTGLPLSGAVYNSDKAVLENMAPVEEDATASSAAYAIGDQMIIGSVLYEATAAIAVNDALVVGTNIKVANSLSKQIKNITPTGTGDMTKAVYDNNGAVENAGGIAAYVGSEIADKADVVSGAVSGNFAGLDSNGNLTDSGSKASDFLTSHQDISGKADKVTGATNGDFAGLDSNGNLTDSGKNASDFADAVHTHTVSEITNFPSLGTAAALDVPVSGDATTTEVVKGDDTRLTDARTPTSHTHTVSQITDFPNIPDAVTVDWTGTASANGVRYQRIGIGSTYYEVAGSKYMEQTLTTDTSNPVNYTFSHADILATSDIQVKADTFGIVPSNIVVSAGQCVVTIPAQPTAFSLAIKIYIR